VSGDTPSIVRFWGTRGSIPTPGPHTTRYGGNTACVTITGPGGELLILDAGSGLRPLGHELMARRNGPLTADILITHTHWDHIQGLPFFKPLSSAGNTFRVFGAAQDGTPLESILRRQMDPMVFPIPLEAFAAAIEVQEIGEGTLELPNFHVSSFRLRHPGTTLGFRVSPVSGGKDLAYVTDNELGPGGTYPVSADWRASLVKFLNGTHTLVHDTMYSDQIIDARRGWGHSTPRQAVDLAGEAGVRSLLLFHHEPEHGDEAMDAMVRDTREYARTTVPGLIVEAAAEGGSFSL
jgi:phosphoribosyl 1,2-cyclic phosphodiesterase